MIDGRFRFDNFVVGTGSRLAASAARAIVETPGAVYNPLFIYSGSGLGKTHLLGAIGFAIRSRHPTLSVEYLSLEDFVDQLHGAIAAGQAEPFKRRYQSVGVLLLDDVQFLTGRVETQSEMLRIFNALQGSGRQIVMTCDRPPHEIADVDQRLITRLAGGLTVDIAAPDFETRVAILRHKCAERDLTFPAGVLEDLARAPSRNVRELQGALNRLVAQHSIAQPPVVPAVAAIPVLHGDPHADFSDVDLAPESAGEDEFDSFVSDLAAAVAQSMEEWRVRLGECIARWSGEGFRTAMLERELERGIAPDVELLDARFRAMCERLRTIEAEAIRLDPKFTGMPVFRDPERLEEAEDLLTRAFALCDPPPAPDPTYTLRTMITTPANHLALRAAAEVVSRPGTLYNPLVIVGAEGSGKTHVLNGIGLALAAKDDGTWTVACVAAEQFADEVIAALQGDTMERWRARYRACDAFILDDVHQLAGKERTQEELFHLFNALHERGCQIIVSSLVAPGDMTDVAARLRSRFDGGLVVPIGRVSEAERTARHTPVPPGDEAAAPTIVDFYEVEKPEVEEPQAGTTPPMPPTGVADAFFLDTEKLILEWPDVDGRVIEEPR